MCVQGMGVVHHLVSGVEGLSAVITDQMAFINDLVHTFHLLSLRFGFEFDHILFTWLSI